MGRLARKLEPVRTFGDAANAYRRMKHIERRLTTKVDNHIKMWEQDFATVPLADIRGEHVENMIVRSFGHLKPNSVNRYLAVFLAIMSEAVKREWLVRVPPVRKPAFFDERDEHLTEEEVERLLDWAFKDKGLPFLQAAALLIMMHTGVRVNELCLMDEHTFMPDGIMVRKRQGKTRDTRFVPYSQKMLNLYKTGFHKAGGRIFCTVARNPSAMSDVMGRALKAGLVAIGCTRAVRVHDLRHTFAHLCGSKGIDLGDLQILMGHANITQTMRYRGFVRSRAVSVLSKL